MPKSKNLDSPLYNPSAAPSENLSPSSSTPSPQIPVRLSETQRQAAVAAVCSGLKQSDVAKKFGVHPNTLNRWMSAVRKVSDGALPADWRSVVKRKAITAIESGLDHPDDPYKRADVGNKVLIGLGEFKAGEGVNLFVNQISSLPTDWKEALVSSDATETVSINDINSTKSEQGRPTIDGGVLPESGATSGK